METIGWLRALERFDRLSKHGAPARCLSTSEAPANRFFI
jgi:hypothetical protein